MKDEIRRKKIEQAYGEIKIKEGRVWVPHSEIQGYYDLIGDCDRFEIDNRGELYYL
jgi:hypothetical protein